MKISCYALCVDNLGGRALRVHCAILFGLLTCSCDGGFVLAGITGYLVGSAGDADQTQSLPACAPAQACGAASADCDDDPRNGCETELGSITDCNHCGDVCEIPHARAVCVDGSCEVFDCELGWKNIDGDSKNGCEYSPEFPTEQTTSWSPCGVFTADCDKDLGLCDADACGVVGDSVWAGFVVVNGCEVDVVDDPKNCGACGNSCETVLRPNSESECVRGQCANSCVVVVDPQNGDRLFADCYHDSEPKLSGWDVTADADGCETDLNSSPTDCGVCGHSCGAQGLCELGQCK